MQKVEIIEGTKNRINRKTQAVIERQRVAAYCRVSTDSEEQLLSYNSQVEHYTNYIKSKPEWTFIGIYADEGITGTMTTKRQEFQRMINDCIDGKIDMVIAKSISRFARNTVDTLKYVRLLRDKNVAVQFEKENINTLSMNGEVLLTILSSLAQQESESISQNVKMGLKMKMKRGELVGFQGCLGYDYDPETKSLSLNEEEAEIVQYIFSRYVAGAGCHIIARELNSLGFKTKKGSTKWGESGVRGIIRNEKYKGDILLGKTFTTDPISKRRLKNLGEEDKFYIKDHHPAIVSAEVYDKAQELMDKRALCRKTGRGNKYSRMYPFSSKIKCGFCGGTASRRKWHCGTNNMKNIWQCMSSTKNGKKFCVHSKGLDETIIEDAFVVAFNTLCKNHKNILKEFIINVEESLNKDGTAKELNDVNSSLDKLENKIKKLVDLKICDIIDVDSYQQKYNKLIVEKEKIMLNKIDLEKLQENEQSLKQRLKSFKEMLKEEQYLTEFDAEIFENSVAYIEMGKMNDDETPNPFLLTFVFKTGYSSPVDCSDKKSHGNIKPTVSEKNEQNLCANGISDTCGMRLLDDQKQVENVLEKPIKWAFIEITERMRRNE